MFPQTAGPFDGIWALRGEGRDLAQFLTSSFAVAICGHAEQKMLQLHKKVYKYTEIYVKIYEYGKELTDNGKDS